MTAARIVEIDFCAYAQGRGVVNSNDFQFDGRETMEVVALSAEGKPVCIGHDRSRQVGTVRSAHVLERDGVLELWMRAWLDDPATCECAERGALRGFSVGVSYLLWKCGACGAWCKGLSADGKGHSADETLIDGQRVTHTYTGCVLVEVSETGSPAVKRLTGVSGVRSEGEILAQLAAEHRALKARVEERCRRMEGAAAPAPPAPPLAVRVRRYDSQSARELAEAWGDFHARSSS